MKGPVGAELIERRRKGAWGGGAGVIQLFRVKYEDDTGHAHIICTVFHANIKNKQDSS